MTPRTAGTSVAEFSEINTKTMSDTIRTFVALELPIHARNAVLTLSNLLLKIGITGLRPVKPQGIHITIKFLGNIRVSKVEQIAAEIIHATSMYSPFNLEINGVGFFPIQGAPQTFWAGVTGDLDAFLALQSSLEDSLAALGFEREYRAFTPHITLARLGNRTSHFDRNRAAKALHEASFRPVSIQVTSISLIQSVIRPQYTEYRRLAVSSLSEAQS